MPHLSEILKSELAKLRERIVATGTSADPDASLDILETGTIRNTGEAYRVNDGWSTLTFAEDVHASGGNLVAIDLDVSAAREVLEARGLADVVVLREGHSIDVLSEMLAGIGNLGKYYDTPDSYNVAFLDSDNDAGLILHEYLIVKRMVRSPGLIMVDDVDMDSSGVTKGHQIVPWLDAHGTPYRLEKRHGDGYETGVLVIEV